MSSERQHINLVIPAHNEENIIEKSATEVINYMNKNWSGKYVLTIVSSGSTDSTPKIARKMAKKYPQVSYIDLKKKGRGLALRKAWADTNSSVCAYLDADLSVSPKFINHILRPILNKEADMAIGSRLLDKSLVNRGIIREIISRSYSKITRIVLRIPVMDYQCGFKAVSGSVVDRLMQLTKDNEWVFDTEIIVRAIDSGLIVKEIPVEWNKSEKSSVKIASAINKFLIGLNRISKERSRLAKASSSK